MRSSAGKIQLNSFDDLFGTGGATAAGGVERIQEISLSELYPFKNHPFRVRDDEAMQETVESVVKYGVLVPGIVRPRAEGGYEIVAGHRRKRASELAGKPGCRKSTPLGLSIGQRFSTSKRWKRLSCTCRKTD